MAHYLIFIETQGCNADVLIGAGLGELLAEGEPKPDFMHVDRGPNGKPGALLTWRQGNQTTDPRYFIHQDQKWTPAASVTHPELGELPEGRFWLGVDTKNPPQPADLIRKNPIPGISVTMADGYKWLVPTISRLPHRYQLENGGEITRVVKDRYEKFYTSGMRVVAEVMEHFSMIEEVRDKIEDIDDYMIPLNAEGGMTLIASALAINYRITWELGFMLDLFDEQCAAIALMAFCELSEIRTSIIKKKELPPVTIRVGSYSESGNKV